MTTSNHLPFFRDREPVLPARTRPFDLLRSDRKGAKPGQGRQTAPRDDPEAVGQDAVVCRQCLHEITSAGERTAIDGAHAHTFANPQGILFEIGCYRDAWGCGFFGPSSSEFTWFADYAWRIAICANCQIHLGWRFSSSGGHVFHGLIIDRIMANNP